MMTTRFVLFIAFVASCYGMAILDAVGGKWRTAVAAGLVATANLFMFGQGR